MNNEAGKTMMYVAVAAIAAVLGISLAPAGPKATKDGLDALIGKEFYEKFKDPAEATSIDVIAFDPKTATAQLFGIEFQNGLWRIPTRYNYPADAKDRLGKVAASIIGLKREALAGRTESEQAEFQVLDPKSEAAEKNAKGVGNRVTLRSGNTVLADYIIGKQVANRTGYYYVRKPDEKQTFIAKVELNLSTKFTDWIESDVLSIEGTHLSLIDIQKHTLEISRSGAKITGEERNLLTRDKSSDPWKLEGLDEATEEVDQDQVRKVVSALDDLKIVGVRPKPEPLREDLRNNEGIKIDQDTAEDLMSRGFFVLRSPRGGGMQMVSKEGDLVAGTDQGVEYEMHFGDEFQGSEEEIELGFVKKSDEEKPADGEAKDGDQKDDEKKDDAAKDDKSSGKKKSRFMYVTARVNPDLLLPKLEEPVKPEPPSEDSAAPPKTEETKTEQTDEKATEKPADEKATDEKATEEKPKEETKSEEAAKDDTAKTEEKSEEKSEEKKDEASPPAEPAKPDPNAAYEAALKKYEADKLKYDSDAKARETKLEEAAEKVKNLNARFADWYYVISAESFENLRQGRATLVKAKPDTEKKTDGEAKEEGETKEDTAKDEPAKEDAAKPDETPKDPAVDTEKKDGEPAKEEKEEKTEQ